MAICGHLRARAIALHIVAALRMGSQFEALDEFDNASP
jgi:hypothetical protein